MFVVDGLCCCRDPRRIDYVFMTMNDVFESRVNDPDIYVGLQIKRDRSSRLIFIHQRAYLECILCDYGFLNCAPISTPANCNSTPCTSDSADTANNDLFPFVNAIGSLQFASTGTRPDTTNSVSNAARFKSEFTHADCNAIKKVFRYLRITLDFKLDYGGTTSLSLLSA